MEAQREVEGQYGKMKQPHKLHFRTKTSQEGTMDKTRFSDEWKERVMDWAAEHSAMIARYERLQNYQKMQDLEEEFTPYELRQIYCWECRKNEIKDVERPEEDVFWED